MVSWYIRHMRTGYFTLTCSTIDAICLAIQGAALGLLFGKPALGAVAGAIVSLTDRIFAPLINEFLPGTRFSSDGFSFGT